MIAKLMELANTLFRYRGHGRRRARAEWDEAIRLLLLMLAPGGAAHQRGAVEPPPGRGRRAVGLDPHASVAGGRPDAPSSSRPARSRSRSTASCATRSSSPADATTADIEAAVLARERIRAILDGRAPDRVVVAGGGRLVNLVVR